MQELRLVGVHEDGEHLLLAGDQGARFQVPVDDALRAAVRHQPASFGRASGQAPPDVGPREVQAFIRAGLTTDEVAERSGWTVEKVRRYEVPILAEREYVTGMARLVRLRHRGSTAQPTLAARVADRLRARGVDVEHLRWDAFRPSGSEWTVVVIFAAGGRQRQATWAFDPVTRVLHAQDDEARWLTEDDPSPAGPLGKEVPVYDVEADGGVEAASSPSPDAPAAPTTPSVPVDLVTAMRQRSNARLRGGVRRRADTPAAPTDQDALPVPAPGEREALPAPEAPTAALPGDPASDPSASDVSSEPAAPGDESDATARSEPAPRPSRTARSSRRSSRTPVPTWKDVVLGTKPASE